MDERWKAESVSGRRGECSQQKNTRDEEEKMRCRECGVCGEGRVRDH